MHGIIKNNVNWLDPTFKVQRAISSQWNDVCAVAGVLVESFTAELRAARMVASSSAIHGSLTHGSMQNTVAFGGADFDQT